MEAGSLTDEQDFGAVVAVAWHAVEAGRQSRQRRQVRTCWFRVSSLPTLASTTYERMYHYQEIIPYPPRPRKAGSAGRASMHRAGTQHAKILMSILFFAPCAPARCVIVADEPTAE